MVRVQVFVVNKVYNFYKIMISLPSPHLLFMMDMLASHEISVVPTGMVYGVQVAGDAHSQHENFY